MTFGAFQRLGASEEFLSLGTGSESFLGMTAPFKSSGVSLLMSRGEWQPPRVGRFVSELCVGKKSPAALYKSSGVGLLVGVCFFASFCASQSLGVLEGFLSLGTDGEGFLGPTEMFESSGVDLLGSRGDWRPPWVERLLLELWVKVDSPAAL